MEDKVTWHFGHISAEPGSNRALQLMQRATGSAPATHWVGLDWGRSSPGEVMVSAENSYAGQGRVPPAARRLQPFDGQKQRSKPGTPDARYASAQPCEV